MTANPIDLLLADGAPVDKSAFRGYEKQYVRKRMADADEVRNTSLSGQFGGLYISSQQAFFDLDPLDTTTEDDGVTCIQDFDGNRFFRVSTGGFAIREEATVGDVDLLEADTFVALMPASAQPRAVTIPDGATVPNSLTVRDGNGSWSDTNITTFVVDGGKTMNGLTEWIGTTPYGGFTFIPLSDGNYLVQ